VAKGGADVVEEPGMAESVVRVSEEDGAGAAAGPGAGVMPSESAAAAGAAAAAAAGAAVAPAGAAAGTGTVAAAAAAGGAAADDDAVTAGVRGLRLVTVGLDIHCSPRHMLGAVSLKRRGFKARSMTLASNTRQALRHGRGVHRRARPPGVVGARHAGARPRGIPPRQDLPNLGTSLAAKRGLIMC